MERIDIVKYMAKQRQCGKDAHYTILLKSGVFHDQSCSMH